MRPLTLSRNAMKRYAVLLTLLTIASCKSVEEPPVDRTPPGLPDVSLLRATSPDTEGNVTVTGGAGSVESGSRVTVRESGVASPVSRSASAASNGSFDVVFPAQSLQLLEVVAEDAAGNASRAALLMVGAPFSLERQGDAAPAAVAGEALSAPLSARVLDESGNPVADVPVQLRSAFLSSIPSPVSSDTDGLVAWSLDAPTVSGAAVVEAILDDAFRAQPVEWTLQVQAAAAAALVALSGSEQVAAAATAVADPLRVQVQDNYGNAVSGAPLAWVTSAGVLSGAMTSTDATGTAIATWTLPASDGEYQVQVTSSSLPGASADFVGVAGPGPQVDSYTPDPAIAGATVHMHGSGFSRSSVYNRVEFPGSDGPVLGEVQSATPTELVVSVPLQTVAGDLQLQVCGRSATAVSLRIESALGTPVDVPIGFSHTRLETPSGDEEYVLAVYSDATSTGNFAIGSSTPTKSQQNSTPREAAAVDARLHRWLRLQERRTQRLPRAQGRGGAAKPLQEDSFTVLAHLSGAAYETVIATLRFEGSHALIYVDNRVLDNELSDVDVAALGQTFDSLNGSYRTVRNNFGPESDVDSDARVTILLTPTVNGLTPPGSGGFVGGFFFSQDLHAVSNSNNREILYGMVPDPSGRWGNVFAKSPTLDVLDSVLPHELQHLISYNNHVLLRGGDPEELWLNEALSHVAEDLSGFTQQNVLRANQFLQAPELVSMTTAGNSLSERGMSYLFARYVADQTGSDLFADLTQTTSVGVANIGNASGRDFIDWMRDWAATLVLEQEGRAVVPYEFESIDLAGDFMPASMTSLSLQSPTASGTLPVSGVRFYRLIGTAEARTDLEVSGDVRAIVMRIR